MKKNIVLTILLAVLSACSLFPSNNISSGGYNLKPPKKSEVEALKQYEKITATIRVQKRGSIVIDLYLDRTPYAVANFVKLVEAGFYEGITFHRVIPDFIIQTGDATTKKDADEDIISGGPGYTFEDEINPTDEISQGVVAMSNHGPDTNGSEFFIMLAENGAPWLDGRYTIFGRITHGLNIAQKISNIETSDSGEPVEDISIENIFFDKLLAEVEQGNTSTEAKNEQ